MKHYHHLSNEERFYIHQAVREGKRNAEIARALGRDASTIGREKKRNMWPSAYLYTYDWARYFQRQRQRRANARNHRTLTRRTETFIVALLKCYLSPEQISAYLKDHTRSQSAMKPSIASSTPKGTPMAPYAGTYAMPGRSVANCTARELGLRASPIVLRFRPARPSWRRRNGSGTGNAIRSWEELARAHSLPWWSTNRYSRSAPPSHRKRWSLSSTPSSGCSRPWRTR